MRIPEPFFPFINLVMKLLLNSPLHGLMSDNIMVVYFTGRKSGRRRSTPVRYLREGDNSVVCLTSRDTGWWHNFREPATVELQLAGKRVVVQAHAHPDDTVRKEEALRRALEHFPGDAAYHGIVVKRGGAPSTEQLHQAALNDVLVTVTLTGNS